MLLLGIDVGTSSIKISVVDADSGTIRASAHYPPDESEIISPQYGWAEQAPEMWWEHVCKALEICNAQQKYQSQDIAAIGIAYQMHGLVVTNEKGESLRNSIIWCDSRAVEIGNKALKEIGETHVLDHLLNSPGNFTASKLSWVKEHQPELYAQIDKVMLPGDYIALRLTGSVTTSISALSEGVFWDFKENQLSSDIMNYFGFDQQLIPELKPVFSVHGQVTKEIAQQLGLKEGIPVAYKAGDQPNNALSLNVTQPGEVAATAGTSGVIYGVTDQLVYDPQSRVNTFAHVNHSAEKARLGVLLCINGTGSMNRWIKNRFGGALSYSEMNHAAQGISAGSEGLRVLPFGNGAERMLNNKIIDAHLKYLDLNLHNNAHLFRAVQEGIAFAFRYGLDILRENGMEPAIIRAGRSNLFLSDVFTTSFVNATQVPIELYDTDGSYGAAIGAGIGAGIFSSAADVFQHKKPLGLVEPGKSSLEDEYQHWKSLLEQELNSTL